MVTSLRGVSLQACSIVNWQLAFNSIPILRMCIGCKRWHCLDQGYSIKPRPLFGKLLFLPHEAKFTNLPSQISKSRNMTGLRQWRCCRNSRAATIPMWQSRQSTFYRKKFNKQRFQRNSFSQAGELSHRLFDFVVPVGPLEHLSRLRTICGTDDPVALHQIDQMRRASVANSQTALQ